MLTVYFSGGLRMDSAYQRMEDKGVVKHDQNSMSLAPFDFRDCWINKGHREIRRREQGRRRYPEWLTSTVYHSINLSLTACPILKNRELVIALVRQNPNENASISLVPGLEVQPATQIDNGILFTRPRVRWFVVISHMETRKAEPDGALTVGRQCLWFGRPCMSPRGVFWSSSNEFGILRTQGDNQGGQLRYQRFGRARVARRQSNTLERGKVNRPPWPLHSRLLPPSLQKARAFRCYRRRYSRI